MKINLNNNKIKSLFLLSLVGSGLGKEEKTNNQTEIASKEINLDFLPKIAANLTEQGNDADPTLVFAGMPILFRDEKIGDQGICVTSFAVVPTKENNRAYCSWVDGIGFLTSALCCKISYGCGIGQTSAGHGDDVFLVADKPQLIGMVGDTVFAVALNNPPFTDFGFVNTKSDLQLSPYVVGESDDGSFQLYPVIGMGSVVIGSEVCAYGPISGGYHCGEVVDMDLSRWTDSGIGPVFFKNLNKVDLGDYGFYTELDWGGPVYTVSNIGGPVAQALGYISKVDNSDQHHNFIYYTPIDKALEEIAEKENCHYTLMTYNETSEEEFQAQVEIPAKN